MTPQIIHRFSAHFPGKVGLVHYRLSEGENYDTWRRARLGQLTIIVGPRSALFTPLPDPGLIIVDECHRGSAAEDSAWREILDHFSGATHIGLTATPKETKEVSNIHYFGEPVYAYSLRQGIDDGFLAPYKVVRIDIDKDLQGWRPSGGRPTSTAR